MDVCFGGGCEEREMGFDWLVEEALAYEVDGLYRVRPPLGW